MEKIGRKMRREKDKPAKGWKEECRRAGLDPLDFDGEADWIEGNNAPVLTSREIEGYE